MSARRIKQIAAMGWGEEGQSVVALADDGTLWEYVWDGDHQRWMVFIQLPDLPPTNPEGTEP